MVRSQMEELGCVHIIIKAFTFFCSDLLLLVHLIPIVCCAEV